MVVGTKEADNFDNNNNNGDESRGEGCTSYKPTISFVTSREWHLCNPKLQMSLSNIQWVIQYPLVNKTLRR